MQLLTKEERNNLKETMLKITNNNQWLFHKKYNCYVFSRTGKIKSLLNNKELKLNRNRAGYLYTGFYSDLENKRKTCSIHRLILETFCPLSEDLYQFYEVNHIDGDKNNNHLTNLEWVTRKENLEHSNKFIKRKKWTYYKLSESDVKDIKEFKNLGFKIKDIAKSYNSCYEYIRLVIKGDVRCEIK